VADGHHPGCLLEDTEDIALAHEHALAAVDFDFGAAVFRDEDFVSDFNGELDDLALLVLAISQGQHFGFLGLFLGGVREEDAALRFCFAEFDALHKDTSAKWGDASCHVV
jgi:hypothetical protein